MAVDTDLEEMLAAVKEHAPRRGARGRRIRMVGDAMIRNAIMAASRCIRDDAKYEDIHSSAVSEYEKEHGVASYLMLCVIWTVVEMLIYYYFLSGDDTKKTRVQDLRSKFRNRSCS